MKDYLKGKKTYILAAGALVYGVAQWLTGEQSMTEVAMWLWGGALGATIRAGIAKVEMKVGG